MAVVSNVAPYIDPNVQHVGVSKLRSLSASKLSDMRNALVIQDNDTSLAVLLKYEQYMAIQEEMKLLKETIQILTDQPEREALETGLKQMADGHIRPLSEVKTAAAAKAKEGKNGHK